jgi:O-acetyl-ADP-ribose deacetylase (regulator of RNase III)
VIEVRVGDITMLRLDVIVNAANGALAGGGDQGEAECLRSCYRQAFQLALQKQARSIAFAGISTGVYGFPKRPAVQIAVRAMREYAIKLDRMVACCFSGADA